MQLRQSAGEFARKELNDGLQERDRNGEFNSTGCGYMTEYEIERELRDALGSKLYSGTSEIQRTIVASLLGV